MSFLSLEKLHLNEWAAKAKGLFHNRLITYGYASTRVKARKALILERSFFEDLAERRTLDGMTAMLEKTYYKKILTDLSVRYSGTELLEMAAEVHFKEVMNKVRGFLPDDGLPVFNMLMRKWDILNLRTIISSRRAGRTWEQMKPFFVPVGELRPRDLKKIAESPPEKIYLQIKNTPVGREILAQSSRMIKGTELEQLFLKALKDAKVLNQLQVILDSSFYNYLQEGIVSSDKDVEWIMELVLRKIDLKNIMNVLRMKHNGITEYSKMEPHLIKGGWMSRPRAEALVKANSYKEVLEIIRPIFKLDQEQEFSSLSELEVALQRKLSNMRVKIFYKNPVSIATVVGFLFIKEEEMNNLRKIVRGKDYNLSPEEIKEMLIYY